MIPLEISNKIKKYQEEGYSNEAILQGISQSKNYPKIALKVQNYLDEGHSVESIMKGLSTAKIGKLTKPFKARYPTLYGISRGAILETGKDITKMAPWVKYIYPEEREKFMKLSKQKQIRDLLFEDLNFVVLGQAKPIIEGVKRVGGAAIKRFLPKTYEALTKARKIPLTKPTPAKVAAPTPSEAVRPTIMGEGIAEAGETPVQRVMAALKEAKPVRAEQEALYTKARGERILKAVEVGKKIKGEAGYHAKLAQMKGKMERAEFHSIRGKIGQKDIDGLFAQINDSTVIGEFEKLPAAKGLGKMFGEFGGSVPTEGELSLLNNVFGQDFVKTILAKRPLLVKAKAAGLELANIPRSIMASFDLSAPLRQGIFLAAGKPKQFGAAFKDMFKYFGSEKAYVELNKDIAARPTYELMKRSKLAITELGQKLSAREEAFMSSYAEKIPLIGHIVRMSGRAHTGFLKKFRADVFDDFVKKGTELGIKDPKYLKDAAHFINAATGRGSLGSLERAAVPLNAFFFSPRLISSRLTLLNPVYYARLHPQVRKEALKSLFTFAGAATTISGLAVLGGAKVGADPRSADFMKIKIGNTRYDVLGGFQQPIRLAAQLISGEVISSTTGKTVTLGEGYKPLTRLGIMGRFVEYKEAPVVSFATSLLRGRTAMGEKTDIPTEIANRFIPMVAQDMVDLYKERGLEGLPLGVPAIFGVGAQTYGGVQSYGLQGKDYPKLNTELTRLRTSMGFPTMMVFGQELTNKEFKHLRDKTGVAIAKNLTKIIASSKYNRIPDPLKIKIIEMIIDTTKEVVRTKTFPQKMRKSIIEKKREEIKLLNLLKGFR